MGVSPHTPNSEARTMKDQLDPFNSDGVSAPTRPWSDPIYGSSSRAVRILKHLAAGFLKRHGDFAVVCSRATYKVNKAVRAGEAHERPRPAGGSVSGDNHTI